jgi:hypothetical protein
MCEHMGRVILGAWTSQVPTGYRVTGTLLMEKAKPWQEGPRRALAKGLFVRAHNLPEAFKTNKSQNGSLKVAPVLSHAF